MARQERPRPVVPNTEDPRGPPTQAHDYILTEYLLSGELGKGKLVILEFLCAW